MNHNVLATRIKRITEELREKDPGLSVIIQNPGEPDEVVQQSADQLKAENISKYVRSGIVVVIRNYAGMEVKDVPKS